MEHVLKPFMLYTSQNNKKIKMVNARSSTARVESFVWTNGEVELLLRVTLDYKLTKLQENVDWESCHSKYSKIMDAFQAQYLSKPTEKNFPHDANICLKSPIHCQIKKKHI